MTTQIKAHNIVSFIELGSQQGANENVCRRAISQIHQKNKGGTIEVVT